MNKINEAGIQIIKDSEGYLKKLPDGSCQAYLDKLAGKRFWSPGYNGLWTIGWGNTGKDITEGTVWSRAKAEQRFRDMVAAHEKLVARCITVPINDNQFSAMVSLSYNWADFSKSTLVKKVNKGDFEGASKEFAKINKAGGKVYKGLVTRRERERKLFVSDAPSTYYEPTPVAQKTREEVRKDSTTLTGNRGLRVMFNSFITFVTGLFSMEYLGIVQGILAGNAGWFLVGALCLGIFASWYSGWLEKKATESLNAGEWGFNKEAAT